MLLEIQVKNSSGKVPRLTIELLLMVKKGRNDTIHGSVVVLMNLLLACPDRCVIAG